jgi:hypothetical protein
MKLPLHLGKNFLWWIQLAIQILKAILSATDHNPVPDDGPGMAVLTAILKAAVRENADDKATGDELV